METNTNIFPAPEQNFKVEENRFAKENKNEQKKKKIYSAKAATAKKEGGINKRIAFSALIIFIGLIFLARNFGILEFDFWKVLLMFWPVAVIISGISLSAKDGWWQVGLAATTFIAISAMAVMLSKGYFDKNKKSFIIESNSEIINEIIYSQNDHPN